VARLDAGFEDAMTVMALPPAMRRCTRTSNCLERLNVKVKRRAKVISVFPSEGSLIRLGRDLPHRGERQVGRQEQAVLAAGGRGAMRGGRGISRR